MSHPIPESYRDLVDGPILVVVATIMPDGQPQLSVVWCNSDEDHVLINTVIGRQKERNLRRDPRIALFAVDPENPYRFIEIRGVVEEIDEEGAVEHIDELARLYTGASSFYGNQAPSERRTQETRVICRINPSRIRAQG